jgi:hypothetical protein
MNIGTTFRPINPAVQRRFTPNYEFACLNIYYSLIACLLDSKEFLFPTHHAKSLQASARLLANGVH